MKPNFLVRVVSLLVLASVALTAQVARQIDVPLKNWATPLYWQPNQVERQAAAQASPQTALPQVVFSATQVSNTALTFVAVTPCRLVDTRGAAAGFNGEAPFNGPSVASKATLTIPVQSASEASTDTTPAPCGAIPSIAQAYSFNLTVVPHSGGAVDYVTMWPAGATQPVVATLDDPQGAIVSNAAIVPAGGSSGGISVFNDGPSTADFIIDMNGFFAAPTDLNDNTATGGYSLFSNTTGADNTANGFATMLFNGTGSYNTASGYYALSTNTNGSNNVATGYYALADNSDGIDNTAVGAGALESNSTGDYLTAIGYQALYSNTGGANDTATGYQALYSDLANGNVANGFVSMYKNTTGNSNTAIGYQSLYNNTTASGNIAIGTLAAFNVAGGNGNNIHIGNEGASTDSNVITIGNTQTVTKLAGIYGQNIETPNSYVCIDSTNRLGTNCVTVEAKTPSSRRFKDEIADMGDSSSNLFQLRPVTFFYKPQYDDGSHSLQYGLIAEEVADLYPDMVGYDKDGQPNSIKYQMLAPMLLNEMQKQNAHVQTLEETVQLQQEQNRKLEDRLAALEAQLSTLTAAPARPAGDQ